MSPFAGLGIRGSIGSSYKVVELAVEDDKEFVMIGAWRPFHVSKDVFCTLGSDFSLVCDVVEGGSIRRSY